MLLVKQAVTVHASTPWRAKGCCFSNRAGEQLGVGTGASQRGARSHEAVPTLRGRLLEPPLRNSTGHPIRILTSCPLATSGTRLWSAVTGTQTDIRTLSFFPTPGNYFPVLAQIPGPLQGTRCSSALVFIIITTIILILLQRHPVMNPYSFSFI